MIQVDYWKDIQTAFEIFMRKNIKNFVQIQLIYKIQANNYKD